jgi:hypothetical protein
MHLPRLAGIILAIGLLAPFAQAAGTAQLELVGGRSQASAFQDWAKALDKGGVTGVRIRSVSEAELKAGIETGGTPDRPVYIVTGVVVSREELLLPGGRYKRNEVGRLKAWLDDLAQNGLPSQRPEKVAFGLTQAQFDEVHSALAKPVKFTTKDVPRNEAVKKYRSSWPFP